MSKLPRGIDPELLLSQIKNTMPYLFAPDVQQTPFGALEPTKIVSSFARAVEQPLSHLEYFKLCVSAHYLTCATPVPTDVDNQIRQKLWPALLDLQTALEMTDFVLATRQWDFTVLSSRTAYGAYGTEWEKAPLNGHHGEWFTIAAGSYCALLQYKDERAKQKRALVFEHIADEVRRHSEIFGSLWRAGDGLGCLKASTGIAHNFGDLDRVMDMWELDAGDPLRLEFYKLGIKPFDTQGKLRYLGRLWVAGELYKSPIDGSAMALENHRHFALRKPKCLRLRPEFRIPMGPFFDDWARTLVQTLSNSDGLPSESLLEVVDALKYGMTRLPKTQGYPRAIAVLEGTVSKMMPKQEFESLWAKQALALMDDIPSRA